MGTNDDAVHDPDISSDNLRQRTAGIQPSWPQSVNMTNAPAIASWQSKLRLEKIFLNIHWVPQGDNTGAFFKVHTRVKLDGLGTTSARHDGSVSVFIFIPPERVRRLSFDPNPDSKSLGPDTVNLTFHMRRPPALVLPKMLGLGGHTAGDTLKSLQRLTAQLSFTISARITGKKFPAAWMQYLCTAVSVSGLSSIDKFSFQVVPTLYQGQGGQVLEGDCLPDPDVDAEAAAAAELHAIASPDPPPYDDTGPSPPSHHSSVFPSEYLCISF